MVGSGCILNGDLNQKRKVVVLNYEQLWKGLKSDLERWANVGGSDRPTELEVESCAQAWEVMQKREEQSHGR